MDDRVNHQQYRERADVGRQEAVERDGGGEASSGLRQFYINTTFELQKDLIVGVDMEIIALVWPLHDHKNEIGLTKNLFVADRAHISRHTLCDPAVEAKWLPIQSLEFGRPDAWWHVLHGFLSLESVHHSLFGLVQVYRSV